MLAPQLCHGQFTGQPLARSGSRSGISESPAQVLQPQHHPPGPGTRMIMGKYLEDTEMWGMRASQTSLPQYPSQQDKPQLWTLWKSEVSCEVKLSIQLLNNACSP